MGRAKQKKKPTNKPKKHQISEKQGNSALWTSKMDTLRRRGFGDAPR